MNAPRSRSAPVDAAGPDSLWSPTPPARPLPSSGKKAGVKHGANVQAATEVGKKLAEAAKAKGITLAMFDRGQYRFHGRIAALARAATQGGLVCTGLEAPAPKKEAAPEAPAKKEKAAKGEAKPKGEGKPKGEAPKKDKKAEG